MTFYNADGFLAAFSVSRVCTITGAPGTGKTLMAFELAMPFLKDGYSLASNIQNVWQDPLYRSWEDYIPTSSIIVRWMKKNKASPKDAKDYFELPDVCPWVYRRYYPLDEAGRYLRAWKYFENLAQFPRKFRTYICIPSLRVPHADLASLLAICVVPFRQFLPFNMEGGLYYWQYDNGTTAVTLRGTFVYYAPKTIGIYDTDDLSEVTDGLIQSFTAAIDLRQKEYGRHGISALGNIAEDGDTEEQRRIANRIERAALSLSSRRG